MARAALDEKDARERGDGAAEEVAQVTIVAELKYPDTFVNRRVFQEPVLLAAALFAIFWAILRASVQSITIDEATTYLLFINGPLSNVWIASSNNHVLNTFLMWMTTHLFGTSGITVRAPALMGAVLYVSTCYFLCRSITNQFSLRLPLFICLTYNPFIFDFMVAARGYSLADAFFLAAIAVPVWHSTKGGLSLRTSCVLASLALGLSFTANFSFALVDLAVFLGIVAWAVRSRGGESVVRVVEYCTLPGLLIALLICGYTLAHWNRGEMWWGAHSLSETTRSLVKASLYQPDPGWAGSGLYTAMNFLKPLLLPVLGVLCLCQLVVTRIEGSWVVDDRGDERARWLGRFTAVLAGITVFAVVLHWLAFRFGKLPLPLGRTGLFLAPLCTLIAGVIAAAPARSIVSRWLRRGITAVFICLACYFLLCLRLTYFSEWEWNADVKEVFPVLARLNHTYGVTDVGSSWYYVSALNYYRVVSNRETFPQFTATLPDPVPGKSVYVMNEMFEPEFLKKEQLVVIYRGKSTSVVIAVKPGGPVPTTTIER